MLNRSYPISVVLLVVVNVPMAILVTGLLVLDYRREMDRALEARRVTLREEATLIGHALLTFADADHLTASEQFIEDSCEGAAKYGATDHRVRVVWGDRVIHSHFGSAHVDDPDALADDPMIVSRFSSDGLSVEVVESITGIRQGIRDEILMHFSGLLALAAMAGLIVDVALVRLIARPTSDLSRNVKKISGNEFHTPPRTYLSREFSDLGMAIESMSQTLKKAEVNRETNMRRAEKIQNHLLPRSPRIPGLAFAAFFQPAEQVAGDVYDVIRLPDDSWLIYVADLVGHGVAAAMSASVLKMLIEHSVNGSLEPGELLRRVNGRLPKYLSEDEFATVVAVRWQPKTNRMSFASAGHEPTMLVCDGGLRTLDATGLPLGIDPSAIWETCHLDLVAGDQLLMLTDGLAEAHDRHGEMFGRERLAEILQRDADRPGDDLVTRMAAAVQQHLDQVPAQDDLTIVLLRCESTTSISRTENANT